ncbi:MAG: methylaspartate mutase accessory protein GlmL [Planctomycetota bacterium]
MKTQNILITDVGSTTTKTLLLRRVGDRLHIVGASNSPTTVEEPEADVRIGLLKSIRALEKELNLALLDNDKPREEYGFMATSSAGGGLAMVVTGLTQAVTAKSATKAAAAAGGIVLDVLAIDDGRTPYEKAVALRRLRPDMVLLSGGLDGGDVVNNVRFVSLLKSAGLRPKFGGDAKLPVVFAGNIEARGIVKRLLEDEVDLRFSPNLRPAFDKENIAPVREIIHELFIKNVMANAPGYSSLLEWSGRQILPTPSAVEGILALFARDSGKTVLMFDIGGATTDVFSSHEGRITRTVCANYGMSYSISNVMAEAGVTNIKRWIPNNLSEEDLRDKIANKTLNPTSLPVSEEDFELEWAAAREALRLSLDVHIDSATTVGELGLGEHIHRFLDRDERIKGMFTETPTVTRSNIDVVIGAGGVLSKCPSPKAAMMMLVDSTQLERMTELYIDNQFVSPHLGMIAQHEPDMALSAFKEVCLKRLGVAVPLTGKYRAGRKACEVHWTSAGFSGSSEIAWGELLLIQASGNEEVAVRFAPSSGCDSGVGSGRKNEVLLTGGAAGILIDGRGRPIVFMEKPEERTRQSASWKQMLKEVKR